MNPIGVMLNNLERDRLKAFAVAVRHGFEVVHTSALPEAWLHPGPEREQFVAAAKGQLITIAAMFVGFDGQSYADIPSIQLTVGLVIPELRAHRCMVAKQYGLLATELGVRCLCMHLGFLPHRASGDYGPTVSAVRDILDCYRANGQSLHLETGQDSAVELVRFIEEVDRPNLGVNFDPANFLLYSTDEPLSALEVLMPWVKGVHCKDAIRPHQTGALGTEVPLGQGEVNFPEFLKRLRGQGFQGPLIIECEGVKDPVAHILAGRRYLQRLLEGC